MHPAAAAATRAAMEEHIANPHATEHLAGQNAAAAIDKAREEVATVVGADPDEVVFTSGATEADNLALLGVAARDGARRRIVVSAIEHKAVLGPARELARRGYEVVTAPVGKDGTVNPDEFSRLVGDDTLLVSLMLVNNEIGTMQPVARVAEACARSGALLHVDAAQALGWMEIDAYGLGADMLSVSGHKMGGPKGIGALFIRRDVRERLTPILHGGEQEDGLRPGTLPTPLCIGMGVACLNLPGVGEVLGWRQRTGRLERALLGLHPGAWVNGAGSERHPGSVSITFPSLDADLLVARLRPLVAISRGSACTSGTTEPSHVLRAIGLLPSLCQSTVRISTGRFTTDQEIDEAITAFADAIASCGPARMATA